MNFVYDSNVSGGKTQTIYFWSSINSGILVDFYNRNYLWSNQDKFRTHKSSRRTIGYNRTSSIRIWNRPGHRIPALVNSLLPVKGPIQANHCGVLIASSLPNGDLNRESLAFWSTTLFSEQRLRHTANILISRKLQRINSVYKKFM